MRKILFIIIVVLVACISVAMYLNRYNNMTKQGMQAINQTTQACIIDLQHDKNVICD